MRRPHFVYALGAASAIPPLAMLLLLLGGPAVIQFLGLSLLIVPAVGGVATCVSLLYAYWGRPLGWRDVVLIVAVGLFWFVTLPVFWYYKIYSRSDLQSNSSLLADARRARLTPNMRR